MRCAYCGHESVPTREHVLPQWLRRELIDYPSVTPGRGRHLFGGDLVIEDVCADCNNGPLSALDEAAKRYWDNGRDSASHLQLADRELLARWAVKVSYNSQRAVMALGTAGAEPAMPESVRKWILGGGAAPEDLAVSIARMPAGHRDRDGAGTFASNGTVLPRRYVQLRGSVVFLAWDVPGVMGAANQVAQFDRERVPACDLLDPAETIEIPLVSDPDVVRRGFWKNPELLAKMAKRYPAEEKPE